MIGVLMAVPVHERKSSLLLVAHDPHVLLYTSHACYLSFMTALHALLTPQHWVANAEYLYQPWPWHPALAQPA